MAFLLGSPGFCREWLSLTNCFTLQETAVSCELLVHLAPLALYKMAVTEGVSAPAVCHKIYPGT